MQHKEWRKHQIQEMVFEYLKGPLVQQLAYPFIQPYMNQALILVVGSYSIGMQTTKSDLDIEMIFPDQIYEEMLQKAGSVKHLWVHDEANQPLVDIKVRPMSWLSKRLDGKNPVHFLVILKFWNYVK